MSLTLTVDGERWRSQLLSVAEDTAGLVPVAKGNGYGFTLGRLARRTQWLADQGALTDPTLAVGTYDELAEVTQRFDGSLLVLTPWRPWPDQARSAAGEPALRKRVIHTLSRLADVEPMVRANPGSRLVLERRTSMLRHGMSAIELRDAGRALAGLDAHLEGVTLHLPMAEGRHLDEVRLLVGDVIGAELKTRTVWVSHLSAEELTQLRSAYPDFTFRPRVGTNLWLGDRGALRAQAHVLDVHRVRRGDVYGYRGRLAPRAGHLVIVSGGTAHGIGFTAPSGTATLRSRATTLARGGLDAAGLVRSPFVIDGSHPRFAEPPHMQASMLYLPGGQTPPEVGSQVDVRVRYTATTFDDVILG